MYKIIVDHKVYTLAQNVSFHFYHDNLRRLPKSDINSANCFKVAQTGEIFGLKGRGLTASFPWPIAQILQVSQQQAELLAPLLTAKEQINGDSVQVHFAKIDKIAQLKAACDEAIIAGIQVKLSDEQYYHFQLTQEDQLNLFNIQRELLSGRKSYIYHAKGDICKAYSAFDLHLIIRAARKHISYHTTYFNLIKHCVQTKRTVQQITCITYGDDLAQLGIDKQLLKLIESI